MASANFTHDSENATQLGKWPAHLSKGEDKLEPLLNFTNEHIDIYSRLSTSRPVSGFLSCNDNFQLSPGKSRNSASRDFNEIASPGSYKTAHSSFRSYKTTNSSFRSYKTAPRSMPIRESPRDATNNPSRAQKWHASARVAPSSDSSRAMLVDRIAVEVLQCIPIGVSGSSDDLSLYVNQQLETYTTTNDSISRDAIIGNITVELLKCIPPTEDPNRKELRDTVTMRIRKLVSAPTDVKVFTSEWLEYLKSRDIILDPSEELNWSGKGQHVEYHMRHEDRIPLKAEKILGYSATALVESVMCRRIRLARKLIKCSRRMSQKQAITEVEHLQRLQHSHIVRVVGTYTLRKNLAILLYPAAEWNLDEFMDDTIDLGHLRTLQRKSRIRSLGSFLGCLSNAIHFVHNANIKHMDIKPKNLLIRQCGDPLLVKSNVYKIYIADFGIARSYKSVAESETDSPTSFTRAYAAPEVVLQDTRGFRADIFSLGCVFMEILSTILSNRDSNERLKLQDTRCDELGDSSYHANIDSVLRWFEAVQKSEFLDDYSSEFEGEPVQSLFRSIVPQTCRESPDATTLSKILPQMLQKRPQDRPKAWQVMQCTFSLQCGRCNNGPEPFEAAARPMGALTSA